MSTRILVIEDNPVNMHLMVYMLKAFGYEPLPACDGCEGLELARTQSPALILCDIQLPGLDGYAIAHLIKQDTALRHVPLLAVTAYAMVGDQEKILAAGFDGYVSKPVDPASLLATISRWLKHTPPAHECDVSSPGPERTGAGPTVLVLDDQRLNLDFQLDLLEPLGYRVLTAVSIPQAVTLAHQTHPNLIISDVGLNDTHGFDFIRQMKRDSRLKSIPFIFMTTTHWNDSIREEGLALGADRFLFRPIDTQVLLKEIEGCLRPDFQSC